MDVPASLDRLPGPRWSWLVLIGLGAVRILDGLEVCHRWRRWKHPDQGRNEHREESDAAADVEPEARAPIRAHQGRSEAARGIRGLGRGDRRENCQQRARSSRRVQAVQLHLNSRYLLGSTRRFAVSPRRWWANQRPALRGRPAQGCQRSLEDDEGRTRASRKPLSVVSRGCSWRVLCLKPWWLLATTDHPGQSTGEIDGGAILEVGADDLDSDWQSAGGGPDRRHRGRQVRLADHS